MVTQGISRRPAMNDLNLILIKAKRKKVFKSVLEIQEIIDNIRLSDKKFSIDWDSGAGEEWVRLCNEKKSVVCMMNTKIGIAFIRKDELTEETIQQLNLYYLFNVSDYSTEEWKIDLEELKRKIPEISWNASPYAVDINSFSLDDFYFATI